MSFEPRNLLVTGGAGFIGTNFVRHWLGRPGEGRVVVLDALTYAGNAANLEGLESDPRFRFVHADICDERAVRELMEAEHIDTLVHFAAESHVDRSILGPDDFIRTNVVGTHALLKVARELWLEKHRVPAHRFHHVSTDEVYGSLAPEDPAFTESTPYAPNSPYSASKAGSDHLVRAYHETYGLDTTVTNCSNNYGPYQFPEKLIPLIIVNILRGQRLPVYGDGRQIRDWLHVDDHCHAVELALRRGRAGQVYNIGGNSETANIDLVRMLCEIVDRRMGVDAELRGRFPDAPAVGGRPAATLIEHVRDRPGHDRRYAIDFSKARRELGYEPRQLLHKGLTEAVDWYVGHVDWWRALLDRSFDEWVQKNYAARHPGS
ncbi:MAG TPA: dTDP-glucose 4,6-dehydratase [Steroidobacteraceae bacterium]|nr:dTDP-glucose 4,6-dehydratase [Steroidobacteraceae bacterium]